MSLFKRKSKDTGNDVYAFISGNTIPITEVNDPVFSAKTLGDGLAIIPSGELICAPCAGTISMVAEGSNHAVGMTLANGAEILIHVGLDTVSLYGKGFKILVKEGQKVKPGTKLLKFDKSFIESELQTNYLVQFHGFNCLKKSLPLSSTRMNAGKSSTSIFQIASMPSSGYSTHSMLLILF